MYEKEAGVSPLKTIYKLARGYVAMANLKWTIIHIYSSYVKLFG